MKIKIVGIAFVSWILSTSTAISSIPVELNFDPFSYLKEKSETKSQSTRAQKVEPEKVNWRPMLRATIAAGNLSIANVEGKIVKIGESFEGFTLVKVGSQSATFEKNKERVVLKMAPKRKKK